MLYVVLFEQISCKTQPFFQIYDSKSSKLQCFGKKIKSLLQSEFVLFQGRAVLLHQGWPTPPGPQQGVSRRGGSNHNHAGPHRPNHRLRGGGFSFHNHQTRRIHPPHSTRTKGKHSFETTSFHRLHSVRYTETVG